MAEYRLEIRNGLMDIHVGSDRNIIGSILRRAMVRWSGDESSDSMDKIYRCSRMCFELYESGSMSSLAKEDVDILYSLRMDEHTHELFRMINRAGGPAAATTRGMSPSECHEAAMSVLATMSG